MIAAGVLEERSLQHEVELSDTEFPFLRFTRLAGLPNVIRGRLDAFVEDKKSKDDAFEARHPHTGKCAGRACARPEHYVGTQSAICDCIGYIVQGLVLPNVSQNVS